RCARRASFQRALPLELAIKNSCRKHRYPHRQQARIQRAKNRQQGCATYSLPCRNWRRSNGIVSNGIPLVATKLSISACIRGTAFFGRNNTRSVHENLIGEKLLNSGVRGKRMLFRFSGDNWLGIHLGMTGKIRVEPANFCPSKHDHLTLYQDKRALVFTDSRQFGRVRFQHGSDEPGWWKSDVPEIISPKFDQKFVDQFLDRHRKAPIKAVLLMHPGFSGIGNWMADEILWRGKILPSKRTGKLTTHERAEIFRTTKSVVRK